MQQYKQALLDKELPVTWANDFANFGLPLPIFAHPLPAYLGAFIMILGLSATQSYNLLILLSTILSGVFFYLFLSRKFSNTLSLVGSLAMLIFPYRIINTYIRGALPEIVAAIFFPLILIAVHEIYKKKSLRAFILLYLSVFLLAVVHPMMLVVFGLPLAIWVLIKLFAGKDMHLFIKLVFVVCLSLLTASFYLLPLVLEMKYFYQGGMSGEIGLDKFLGFRHLYDPSWFYFYSHPGPRGDFIKLGLPEFVFVLVSAFAILRLKIKRKPAQEFMSWFLIALLMILLILPSGKYVFDILPGFSGIQYPWRFLGALQFIVPILMVMSINALGKYKNIVALFLVFLLICLRFPQLYGKNFVYVPEKYYEFNQANLHSQNLNTIWSDNTENYKRKSVQAEIISGDGSLELTDLRNASRRYKVSSQEGLRLIDYTFYFPGWTVYVDNNETPIEFQDINYRGLITYEVPAGNHDVLVRFEMTKIRKLGLLLTGFSFSAACTALCLARNPKLVAQIKKLPVINRS